jgi:monoamine oxidase
MHNLTRRSFIAGSTALAAACSMGFRQETADAIVLGGGLAGLQSALTLRDAGMKVILLEAGRRVGGRVSTITTADGPLDVGASQIGRSYARVLDACRRHDLELVPEDRDLLEFGTYFQGAWIDTASWADNPLNRTLGKERGVPPMLMGRHVVDASNPLTSPLDWLDPKFADQDISLRQLMEREGYSEQAIALARFSVPGISIEHTSMLRMWQEEARGKLDASFSAGLQAKAEGSAQHPFGEANIRGGQNELARINNIVGGCSRLPEAMAAALGDVVRLGRTVDGIEMTAQGAQVHCADGSSCRASFVVCALPFTVLRKIIITGDGGAANRKAIAAMPYAKTARMYLTVEKPFWEEDGLPASFSTDGPLGMFWAIDNSRSGGARRAMVVLTGEAGEAIAKMPGPDAESFLHAELAKLRPASKGALKQVAFKDWKADPLQLGCGFSMEAGQVNAFGREMHQPWGVMHFAGEHMRQADFGMEAAMESAERAAAEVLVRAG